MNKILIYCASYSPRHEYIFRTVFSSHLGLQVMYTLNEEEFIVFDGPKINYSTRTLTGAFHITPCGILDAKGWQPVLPALIEYKELQVIFRTECDMGFDVLGAAFWMLTRHEEYAVYQNEVLTDKHGRFKASDCIMVKAEQQNTAWTDRWILALRAALTERWPHLVCISRNSSILATIDVDNAFAFLGKGFKRNMGGLLKDAMKFRLLIERLSTLCGIRKDPNDSWEYIEKMRQKHGKPFIFFFLLADYADFDKNLHYDSMRLKQLIYKLQTVNTIGIHPGYQSFGDALKTEAEIARLAGITGNRVEHSRQHFLRVRMPLTYRILSKAEVQNDYSMGFAEITGFRAGTCHPFTVYDLELDRDTLVVSHPFAFMDGTLNEYMKLSPLEAIEKVQSLWKEVQHCEGKLIGIWHNDTLAEVRHWKNWRQLFEAFLAIEY